MPTFATLVNFNGTIGSTPEDGLIADAAGDLFGTTNSGGQFNDGTVFEITDTNGSYAGTATTLAAFNGDESSAGMLIADPAGDLVATADGGADGDGLVFEIPKTVTGYAGTPVTLFSFNGTDGILPGRTLIADAAGDLFGATNGGGTNNVTNGLGTVFEIPYSNGAYASAPTVLASFDGDDGENPIGGVIADAAGDLFGTASGGGLGQDGTIYEIAKTGAGYASTPITLFSFNGTDGARPDGNLIADADGDLFGTTNGGGSSGDGTVFEIADTAAGYSSAPITLFNFDGTDGEAPMGSLFANAAGDLLGTTSEGGTAPGGPNGDGTVFELSGSGYRVTGTAIIHPTIVDPVAGQAITDQETVAPFATVTIGDANANPTDTVTVTLSAAVNGTLTNLGGGTYDAATGVYSDTGSDAAVTAALDGLVFTPTDHQVPRGQSVTTSFTIADTDTAGAFATNSTTTVTATAVTSYTKLANLADADLENPDTALVADAAGDLFGTTQFGGAGGGGVVYEIAKTGAGYAGTPTIVASFSGADGYEPDAGLITDAAGDLFGTTSLGGANLLGTVFEIANTADGYASAPTILASFNGTDGEYPYTGLIADAAGDLIGTTSEGGANGYGTVFEIPFVDGAYASTPTVLANFTSADGMYATDLVADAAGDLFGTTNTGGANGYGTAFEIPDVDGVYASTPTILVNFTSSVGGDASNLILDAAGNLFGTSQTGGVNGAGSVFEIAETGSGYASTATTVASFGPTGGRQPTAGLIMDAAGDLFGTTSGGSASGTSTVFEIAKSGNGYASTPTTLFSFDAADGENSDAGLIADAAGDLFGTATSGGTNADGTAFELSNTGFQVAVAGGQTQAVLAGQTAVDPVVSDGGNLVVTSGATSFGTVVESGATQTVDSGGIANGTTVSSGGVEIVSPGGAAAGTTLDGGEIDVGGGTSTVSAGSGGGTAAFTEARGDYMLNDANGSQIVVTDPSDPTQATMLDGVSQLAFADQSVLATYEPAGAASGELSSNLWMTGLAALTGASQGPAIGPPPVDGPTFGAGGNGGASGDEPAVTGASDVTLLAQMSQSSIPDASTAPAAAPPLPTVSNEVLALVAAHAPS